MARTDSSQPERSDFLETYKKTITTPWPLVLFCLIMPAIPYYIVVPGPLKSNGTPGRLIAFTMFALAVAALLRAKPPGGVRVIHPGVWMLLTYISLWLFIWGLGITTPGYAGGSGTIYGIGFGVETEQDDAGKNRAIVGLLAYVGVGIYTTMRTFGEHIKSIVMGSLAIGLSYNNVIVILQRFGVDWHLLLQPPGFVINTNRDGEVRIPTGEDRLGVTRLFGTSGHAIEYSMLAALTIPLLIHFVQHGSTRRVRLLSLVGALLALAAMPLAVSRTGIVALLAAMVVVVWSWRPRFFANAVVVTLITLVVASVGYPDVVNSLWQTIVNSADDGSVLTRIFRYAWVGETFRQNPIFGVGLGGASVILDNQYLQDLVQGGIVGVISVMLLTVGGLFCMNASLRKADSPRHRSQIITVGAMFFSIMVSGWTFDLFAFQQVTNIYFIAFGLLASDLVLRYQKGYPAIAAAANPQKR
jgi:hypothetical protein